MTTEPADRCPQCGAKLMTMTGDGVLETLCSSCGFVMRQHPAKPVPHEPYELVRAVDAPPIPRVVVVRTSRKSRGGWHPVWIAAWVVALYCIYLTLAGADSYLPIYLADEYLGIFAFALALQRVLHADRTGHPLPEGPVAHMGLFVASVASGYVAAHFAPRIGEPNYCWGTTTSLLTAQVPRVFRCTYSPFFLVGFVGAYWALGWLLIRWGERGDD